MNRVFLDIQNHETGRMLQMEFSPEEVDGLVKNGIVDIDSLGYAMTEDQKAFDEALIQQVEKGAIFSYSDLVKAYLTITGKDVRIRP